MSAFTFPPAFFVTGTDTNVGKTIVSALLTLGLGGAYWKPIQSGLFPSTDTDTVRRLTGLDASHFRPERFRLTEPLSPHAAAAIDGVHLSLTDFELPIVSQPHLIVEGAGGLCVPINEQDLMIDLIQYLQLPVCLVARSGLGTINHTLLSIERLRQSKIPLLGVILNGLPNPSNAEAIVHYGKVKVLAELDPLTPLTPETIAQAAQKMMAGFCSIRLDPPIP